MSEVEKEVDTDYINIKLVNGIVVIFYKPDVEITLSEAKEIVQTRLDFVGNESYPTLADIRNLKSLNREARDHFSSDDGNKGVLAGALLSDSSFTTILGNFFLKISLKKGPFPTKIFTDRGKAMEWLKQYK